MNTWFRFYNDVINDPKVQMLPKALRWSWVELLCLASKHDGILPPVEQIAFSVRASVHDAQADLDALILVGLIDIRPDGKMTPHNWSNRQFVSDSSTDRVRKHREKKEKTEGNVSCNVSETPPDQTKPDSEIYNYPSSLDAVKESEVVRSMDFIVMGIGRGGSRSISHEARRAVCAQLGIGDCAPLVAIYEAWPQSRKARSHDALFKNTAGKFYAEAAEEVRKACLPIEPEPLPPVKPSSELLASLKGARNARTVRSY